MENIYSTKLITRSTTFVIPLGILLILSGITSIGLSSIDSYNHRSGTPAANSSAAIDSVLSSNSLSEKLLWVAFGKGIWCGLFYVALGITSLIVYREKTLISIRILSLVAFISLFLSLFLSLSSIMVIKRYMNVDQKTSDQTTELILNALLVICGVLSLIVSLILSIGTLITGNFCQNQSDDIENIQHFDQQVPPPSYSTSAPTYYG